MQFMEVEEGHRKVQTVHNNYVIPEIKSFNFLNLKQKNFNSYFA